MAKHRAPTTHFRAVVAAVASLVVAGAMAVAAPASGATDPLIGTLNIRGTDNYDIGACSLNVKSVNEATQTVQASISAQSRPVASNLAGYLQIVHNEINCTVFSPAGSVLQSVHKGGNAPSVGTGLTAPFTMPRYIFYTMCGYAQYTLRSGSVFQVSLPCASGPNGVG